MEHQLSYAPPPAWLRRKAYHRLLIIGVLLVLAGVGWRWGPRVLRRATLMYWQRRCMNCALPPDCVVLDDSPDAKERWAARPGYLWHSSAPVQRSRPAEREGGTRFAYLPSPEWAKLSHLTAPTSSGKPSPGIANVFLHRRSAAETERLIVVDAATSYDAIPIDFIPPGSALNLVAYIYEPVGWSGSRLPAMKRYNVVVASFPDGTRTRMFAAQPDPTDDSKFRIVFELNGERFSIACQMRGGDLLDMVPSRGEFVSAPMKYGQLIFWEPFESADGVPSSRSP